jgi:type VI secretion system protein ImpE
MTAHELFQKGSLREAVAAALDDVKKHPGDAGMRAFLAELLCFSGDLERADRQLDALSGKDPDAVIEVAAFRLLIRAEQARQQFYSAGRLPEFLDHDITPALRLHLEASVLLRDGKQAEAAAVLAKAQEERAKVAGTCNGKPFEDFCDLDDLTSSFFEVLTNKGEYFWIPFGRVESLVFVAPARPRDLLWRRAHMIIRNGPDAEVFLPVLYAGSSGDANDPIRLGRATDWRGEAGVPMRGFGQRVFLAGEEDHPILEVQKLELAATSVGA